MLPDCFESGAVAVAVVSFTHSIILLYSKRKNKKEDEMRNK